MSSMDREAKRTVDIVRRYKDKDTPIVQMILIFSVFRLMNISYAQDKRKLA